MKKVFRFGVAGEEASRSTVHRAPCPYRLSGMTMDKSKVNLIIDALLFLCVMAITGIGLLMKYVLLPGKETAAVYGRKVDLFLFGMDRHAWGRIHLIIAFVLLGLLTLHVVLHWNMIVSIYCR